MKLSVIIVNYNVKHYLEQCLLSLHRSLRGIDAEIIVVDNHSQDGSVAYLRSRFPKVRFVVSRHNLGFAGANNLAISQSIGEYVLLLNPDTIVGESTVSQVVGFMDAHPDGGALGVRMLHATGVSARESRRGKPSPEVAFYKMVGLCDRFPQSHRFAHYYMSYLPWDQPEDIEVVSGAFCLLRREALARIGLLDEDFFMYGEDIDLSCRLLEAGYRNYYYPAKIVHYKGESTQKSSFRYVHVFYEAMLIYFRKHYASMSILLGIPIKMAIYAKAVVALGQMLWRRARKSLGFYMNRKFTPYYIYICIGTAEMNKACEKIAREYGLHADSVLGTSQSLPQGHLTEKVWRKVESWLAQKKTAAVYVVYDVEAYSYDEIFDLMSCSARKVQDLAGKCRIKLGTYSAITHKLITENDIFEGESYNETRY